jgi:hypothetical protein
VIVRILEGTVDAGAEATFAEIARAREFALVSIWDDPAGLATLDVASGSPPAFVREHEAMIRTWNLRHLETFDGFVAGGRRRRAGSPHPPGGHGGNEAWATAPAPRTIPGS